MDPTLVSKHLRELCQQVQQSCALQISRLGAGLEDADGLTPRFFAEEQFQGSEEQHIEEYCLAAISSLQQSVRRLIENEDLLFTQYSKGRTQGTQALGELTDYAQLESLYQQQSQKLAKFTKELSENRLCKCAEHTQALDRARNIIKKLNNECQQLAKELDKAETQNGLLKRENRTTKSD